MWLGFTFKIQGSLLHYMYYLLPLHCLSTSSTSSPTLSAKGDIFQMSGHSHPPLL